MAEKPEVRIILEKRPDGRTELSCVDVRTGKHVRTGICAWPGQVEGEILKLKTTLERAGNRVAVQEA